jgi:tetratricopeptide (TPR) repeat protein
VRGVFVCIVLLTACHEDPAVRRDADRHYRKGIALLESGNLAAAREELHRGTALAPIDPALYLPLARACRDHGLSARAIEFYRKYLATAPRNAAEVTIELAALDADLDVLVDAPSLWPFLLPLVGLAGLALLLLRAARVRRRRLSLDRLCDDNPELQPAIAYLIGCLRHELFKHRILAVGDAVRSLERGDQLTGQPEFLKTRLYGGLPLGVAWAGHLASFIRALGPRFDLSRHDPEWAAAGRAITELARLEVALLRGDRDAPARLERAWSALERFDRRLGLRLRGMTHTLINAALLQEVVDAVRAEGIGEVEISIGEIPPQVHVILYRVDLILLVKNLLRNAVRASARGPRPARVCLDVACALEATGEEAVRVRVRDTSPEPLPRELPARRDRGLGIISETLDRYDGSLEVSPGEGEFQKSVSLRLFRALDQYEAAA